MTPEKTDRDAERVAVYPDRMLRPSRHGPNYLTRDLPRKPVEPAPADDDSHLIETKEH